MRKAFFFDYDGTLVNNETKYIPESAIEALKELKRQGHLLFANTGRTKGILDPEIYDWPFDGMILGCGTYIVYQDEVLLDIEVAQQRHALIRDLIKKHKADAFYEGKNHLYITKDIQHKDLLGMMKRYEENKVSILPEETVEKSFSKLFVCFSDLNEKEAFAKEIVSDFTYIDRGIDRCELVPKGYTKATGIALICEHLHIAKEDCYVFGDSNNDLPMFEYISNSILIGGENPELSDRVMYTSEDADHDGLAKALKHLGFIE